MGCLDAFIHTTFGLTMRDIQWHIVNSHTPCLETAEIARMARLSSRPWKAMRTLLARIDHTPIGPYAQEIKSPGQEIDWLASILRVLAEVMRQGNKPGVRANLSCDLV